MAGEKLHEWIRPGARETDTTKNRNYYRDAIATETFDRGSLYVGADGKLFKLNANLEEQNVLDLSVRKNADDILIDGDTAYLLDDEWAPFYAFTIDISNPKEMSIMNTLDFSGVNKGLDGQWLDREGKKWYMTDSSSTSGGSTYSIKVIDLGAENPYQVSEVNIGNYSVLLGEGGSGWTITSDLDSMDGYFLVSKLLKDTNKHDEPSRYVRISRLTIDLQLMDEYELPKSVWPTGNGFGFQMRPFQYGGIFRAGDKFSLFDFSSTQPMLLHTGVVQDLTNIIQAPGE